MRRKIIDDHKLQYPNDLFEIKLNFYDPSRIYCNFLNLYGRYVLKYKSFITIFSL